MFTIKNENIYKTKYFRDLSNGEIFEFNDKLYMKNTECNATNLHNGKVTGMYGDAWCYIVDGELTYRKIPVSEVEK